MLSLFQWLQEKKNYTAAEAEETICRWYEMEGFDVPEEVKKDIREYTEEFIQSFN